MKSAGPVPRTPPGIGLVLALLAAAAAANEPGCPPAAAALERLESLGLERASRTTRFEAAVPTRLYQEAARRPGTVVVERREGRGIGVVLAPLPLERLWRAVNDEDHHALAPDYLPVRHSEVIGGTPSGTNRLLFQYFHRWGFGRWWVSGMSMNGPLFERSGGSLWELLWQVDISRLAQAMPPAEGDVPDLSPIANSRGAWLLARVDEGCTLVEYFNWAELGGVLGAMQFVYSKRALRDTLDGLLRLAGEHLNTDHSGLVFVKPDGSPLAGNRPPGPP